MLIIILPVRHFFSGCSISIPFSPILSVSFSFCFVSSITIIFITPRCQVCYYYPNLQYATYYQLQFYIFKHRSTKQACCCALALARTHLYTKMNVIVKWGWSKNKTQLQVARPNVKAPFLALFQIIADYLRQAPAWYRFGGGVGVGESYDFASYAYILYFNVAQKSRLLNEILQLAQKVLSKRTRPELLRRFTTNSR